MFFGHDKIVLYIILTTLTRSIRNEGINNATTKVTKLKRLISNDLKMAETVENGGDNSTSNDTIIYNPKAILDLIKEDGKNFAELIASNKPMLVPNPVNISVIDDLSNNTEVNIEDNNTNNSSRSNDNNDENLLVNLENNVTKDVEKTSNNNSNSRENKIDFIPSPYLGSIQEYDYMDFIENSKKQKSNETYKNPHRNLSGGNIRFAVGSVSEPIFPYKFVNSLSNLKNVKFNDFNSLPNPAKELEISNGFIQKENNDDAKIRQSFKGLNSNSYPGKLVSNNKPVTEYSPPDPYERGVSDSNRFRFPNQSPYLAVTTTVPHLTLTNLQKPMKFEENADYNNYVDEHNSDAIPNKVNNMQRNNGFADSIFFTTEETEIINDRGQYLGRPYTTSATKHVSFPEAKKPPSVYLPSEGHNEYYEVNSGKSDHFKKALKILAALLPLGLFVAALTPNIIHINTTQPTDTRLMRQTKGKSRQMEYNVYYNYLQSIIQSYYDRSTNVDCDFNEICDTAVRGSRPNATFEEHMYWWLATRTPKEISGALNLKGLFEAISNKSCQRFRCASLEDDRSIRRRTSLSDKDNTKIKRLKINTNGIEDNGNYTYSSASTDGY